MSRCGQAKDVGILWCQIAPFGIRAHRQHKSRLAERKHPEDVICKEGHGVL